MKPRSKWLIAEIAIAAITVGSLCMIYLLQLLPQPQTGGELPDAESLDLPIYEIIVSAPAEAAETQDAPDLLAQIRQAGISTVLATLPPGSVTLGEVNLSLQGERQALVTGTVETPPEAKRKVRRYRFRIEVSFLPTGDTECAFPEFEEE